MAEYKGTILAGIEPLAFTNSQTAVMSRTSRGNYLIGANQNMRYQLMWDGLNEDESPSKSNFSSGEGMFIPLLFLLLHLI